MIGDTQEVGLPAIEKTVERVADLEIADDVKESVDILCGYTWPAAFPAQGFAQRIKQRLRKHVWIEYAYSRSLWSRRLNVHRATMRPVDVRVTFVPNIPHRSG